MGSSISDEEKRQLRSNFDLMDETKTGHILSSRLALLVRGCGENPSESRMNEYIRQADADDGVVSFERFMAIMQDLRDNEKRLTADDIEAAFRVFDPNNTGTIHRDELKKVLTTLGEKLSDAEVDELLGLADVPRDGMINYADLSKKLAV